MADQTGGTAVKSWGLADTKDIALGIGVVAILGVMILPLPTTLLDFLLTFNITIAIIILLTGMYTLKPLDFSIFPSLLLVITLFRLSLNVASTRLILLRGDIGLSAAGQVIKAFGSFVVGGNYIVGMIIFAILVIINFVVITKGAGRIAEVAARFTLDAMPGKQMAIDADLNAGLIDENEARSRRAEISREADFYGAMDGASKFVRGDAVAGLIITVINILGGLIIGVLQQGMNLTTAAQTYTVLTVGDGLVTQIPALIVSTSAGIIVSRAGTEKNMSRELANELFRYPQALVTAGGIIFLFGLMPGLPKLPFIILGSIFVYIGLTAFRQKKTIETERIKLAEREAAAVPTGPERVEALLPLDVLELEVGYGLIPLVDEEQNGELLERIRSIRRQFALEMGFVVPPMHVRDNLQLKPAEYSVIIKGIEIARVELMLNHFLAMDPGDAKRKIEGIETTEPAFNLPAIWIPEHKKAEAQHAGYTVVDPATVIATHLTELIRSHADEILNRQDVQSLIDNVAQTNSKVVEELIPGMLNVGQIQKVLQNLLRERVSIRDLQTILETLADYAAIIKDTDMLTEYVRQRLAKSIIRQYETSEGELPLVTLSQDIEDHLANSISETEQGSFLSIDPELGQRILSALNKSMEKLVQMNYQPVILCSPVVRRHLRKLTEQFIPNLVILSHSEITPTTRIKVLGEAGLNDAS
ncbi:MAG: flagellar biosynthesis protein FlhA [Deltaproteobacteria bacterium]|nr:flagellar biosynthesis protein FlhA [Deltaproteobacteria bacterium]MBW2140053.1 flagellar biosynthesis protein FlhA [Deltaproteobacteria bacterium]MBW2322081.1 flagellar biosynthesis protein FlhA [Deltaproteobacteria bacterium]